MAKSGSVSSTGKSNNGKKLEKEDKDSSAFITGLKKEDNQSQKSNQSLASPSKNVKSNESLTLSKRPSADMDALNNTEKVSKTADNQSLLTPADKINLIDKNDAIMHSQEEFQNSGTISPLYSRPADMNSEKVMLTQDLKNNFKVDETVIHEVDEENHPEDQSEGARHSIMKV